MVLENSYLNAASKLMRRFISRAYKAFSEIRKRCVYPNTISDDDRFFLINFHPQGKPEAPIGSVIQGWPSRHGGMAFTLRKNHQISG